ncbi:uncharacterized protein [Mytilus edulis]|uniref:uncharacterized protein n=1 Tax=Mytilus edulis TaxID=6550 RepID=UPI0039F049BF
MNLRPSEIYFTQSSISSTFGKRTSHRRKGIGDTLDDLAEGRISIRSIPKISVMKENGKWWTADNRRLWIFRYLEKLKKCTEIPVNITDSIDSRKRSSTNGGTDVRIYRGNSPGGVWHRKVDTIKIPDKPNNKNILTVPVVQHHANNQFGGTFSDNKILECNDQAVKPVEPNKRSQYSMVEPDWTCSVFKSETSKIKTYLRMDLKSDDIGTKINFTPTESSPFSCVRQNIPSAINKTEFVVSCPVKSQNTVDFPPESSSPHQSIRYKPYNRFRNYSSIGIFKHTMACKTTSNTYRYSTCIDSNCSYFRKKVRFAKFDDPFVTTSIYQHYEKCYSFYPKKNAYSVPNINDYNYYNTDPDVKYVDTSIYQQSKYYYVHPKKNVHSHPKTNGHSNDSGSDLEDEYEYCYEYESNISDDSQSPDNIEIKAFGESSDESDDETSDESSDDDSCESDAENSDLLDNDDCSPKKISNNALLKDSRHSTKEFQHSCIELSDISHDSSDNSVDEFRCYDLTYKKEGYVSSYWDEENSCEYYDEQNTPFKYLNTEDSAITNDSSDDQYTAVLDRAYLAGSYNSDVDDMIYDYID